MHNGWNSECKSLNHLLTFGPRSGSHDAAAVPLDWRSPSRDLDLNRILGNVLSGGGPHPSFVQSHLGYYTTNVNNQQLHNPFQTYIDTPSKPVHDNVNNDEAFQHIYNNTTPQQDAIALGSNFINKTTYQEFNIIPPKTSTENHEMISGSNMLESHRAQEAATSDTEQFVFDNPRTQHFRQRATLGPIPGQSQSPPGPTLSSSNMKDSSRAREHGTDAALQFVFENTSAQDDQRSATPGPRPGPSQSPPEHASAASPTRDDDPVDGTADSNRDQATDQNQEVRVAF